MAWEAWVWQFSRTLGDAACGQDATIGASQMIIIIIINLVTHLVLSPLLPFFLLLSLFPPLSKMGYCWLYSAQISLSTCHCLLRYARIRNCLFRQGIPLRRRLDYELTF